MPRPVRRNPGFVLGKLRCEDRTFDLVNKIIIKQLEICRNGSGGGGGAGAN